MGGGWIETEFDDLTVTPMADNALKDVKVAEYQQKATPAEKEEKRRQERAAYTPIKVEALTGSRTDITLNGNWLFMPDYQLANKNKAISTETNDQDWHIMSVPNFWTPIRIWLHGETDERWKRDLQLLPKAHNPKAYRTHTTNRKLTVAKTTHSIITGQSTLGTANGWNYHPG